MLKRTKSCGAIRKTDIDSEVVLAGWVNNYRDHGGVIFIDLRDREGITQIVFHPENAKAHEDADSLRHEYVIAVRGTIVAREEGMANPKMVTGEVEMDCKELEILNKSETPPFLPDEGYKVGEERRGQFRYIDLRRSEMQQIMRTRHRVAKVMRDYFDEEGFYEVETPFLCRSTPEGARDFLVPSRLQAGSFYALPQSPQLFKQILMVSGIDKYVQIVRCFRDEDPRADRQAEFTQLDMEMSFVDRDDVMDVNERMIRRIWKKILDVDVPEIPHISYAEAMERFGTDRPDMRFGMELVDVSDIVAGSEFKVFSGAIENGGCVKTIRVPGGAKMSRKETDGLAEWVKQFGAGGLPTTKVVDGKVATGVGKFIEGESNALIERMSGEDGDLFCFGVDANRSIATRVLGELRVKLANDLGMIDKEVWKWVWVVDFPLLEWNDEQKRWDSVHHPFTAPVDEDMDKLESDTGNVLSKAYDLILNGSELGGGSIRIHQSDDQSRVFKLLGIDEEQARMKFGFLLDALKHGAPPHGGIAFGLDRIVMHLCGTTNIRDVIAFPKTQNGFDLMTEAPSGVDDAQLKELYLRTVMKPVENNK